MKTITVPPLITADNISVGMLSRLAGYTVDYIVFRIEDKREFLRDKLTVKMCNNNHNDNALYAYVTSEDLIALQLTYSDISYRNVESSCATFKIMAMGAYLEVVSD